MVYESPILEVTNFDVRSDGPSGGNNGNDVCTIDTPFIPMPF